MYSFNSSANLVYVSISLVCNGELNNIFIAAKLDPDIPFVNGQNRIMIYSPQVVNINVSVD